MDAKRLKQYLSRKLESEISNTMNLWPQIQKQVQPESAPRPRMALRPRHALVVAALAVLATTAYAVFQLIAPPDPGMAAVSGQALQVNQTQSVESLSAGLTDITITLATAYADANRINLTYSVTGESASSGTTLFINPTLSDAQGTVYPFLSAGRDDFEGQDGSAYSRTGTLSFDASQVAGAPSALNLSVHFDVAYSDDDLRAADPNGMMMAGQADFAVSVPFNAGTVVAVNQTVGEVTLQRAVIAPSLTRLEICPAAGLLGAADWWQWTVVGSLTIGGQPVATGETLTLAAADSACPSVIVPYALDGRAGAWAVTLDAFTAEGRARVDGPWTFTFDLP
ncbi:MAG: hypothetical protein IPK52_08035 [Chloroflexi bacterium]|nr:hypothetical protein [Chloroflexota bacterium]